MNRADRRLLDDVMDLSAERASPWGWDARNYRYRVVHSLRAVEQPSGDWLCWFGAEGLAVMPDEASAVAYLSDVAHVRGEGDLVELYLHRVDGSVDLLPMAGS